MGLKISSLLFWSSLLAIPLWGLCLAVVLQAPTTDFTSHEFLLVLLLPSLIFINIAQSDTRKMRKRVV